jgi:hypothetical protein
MNTYQERKSQRTAEPLKIFARVCISGLLKTGEYVHAVDSWTFYDAESTSDFLTNFSDKILPSELPQNIIPFSIFKIKDDFEYFTLVKVFM